MSTQHSTTNLSVILERLKRHVKSVTVMLHVLCIIVLVSLFIYYYVNRNTVATLNEQLQHAQEQIRVFEQKISASEEVVQRLKKLISDKELELQADKQSITTLKESLAHKDEEIRKMLNAFEAQIPKPLYITDETPREELIAYIRTLEKSNKSAQQVVYEQALQITGKNELISKLESYIASLEQQSTRKDRLILELESQNELLKKEIDQHKTIEQVQKSLITKTGRQQFIKGITTGTIVGAGLVIVGKILLK